MKKIRRGDRIKLQKSFKTGGTIEGKVKAKKERPGYLTIEWEDGRTTHVNEVSQCILAVNGDPV